ncbi:transcriptional regulator [Methylobacterium radiotolerans]|uniref:transcriptional regulator n=1 Tax=Methylobacterium radiotolerans TaxID=31998 RepID=UPI003CC7D978
MGSPRSHPVVAEAIAHFRSQTRLAAAIGSSQSAISRMLLREIQVTAEVAVAIDAATRGTIPRHRLRPDLWSAPPTRRQRRAIVEAHP